MMAILILAYRFYEKFSLVVLTRVFPSQVLQKLLIVEIKKPLTKIFMRTGRDGFKEDPYLPTNTISM